MVKTSSIVLAAAAVGLSEAFCPSGVNPIDALGRRNGINVATASLPLRPTERVGLLGASMARKPFLAGNWKCNPGTINEAKALASAVIADAKTSPGQVAVFVPHTYVQLVADMAKGTNVEVGGQNCYIEKSGAFTGATSLDMLKSVGAKHVLIGHSERRSIFGADDEFINKQMKVALAGGLKPLLCIGETKDEYEEGINVEICTVQLAKALKGISAKQMRDVTIAYEPVWAIGTGLVCDAKAAQSVHEAVRALIAKLYNDKVASEIRIQYGGSVTPESVDELMSMPDIDGCLVGGASLDPKKFQRIMNFEAKSGQQQPQERFSKLEALGGFRDKIFSIFTKEPSSPAPSSSAPSAPRANESVADILARAAAMGSSPNKGSPAASYSAAAPAASSGPVPNESVADILARAAAMAGSRTSAGGSSPAPSSSAPSTPRGNESVADILARARAMESSPNKGSPAASRSAASPSAPAPRGNESVADILARAAAMGSSPNAGSPARQGAPASAPVGKQSNESIADILARAASMAMSARS